MAQLARLTAGLELVQQGLDELDGHIRQELLACSALRKQAAVKRNETEQLASLVEEVSCCDGLGGCVENCAGTAAAAAAALLAGQGL
jgi:hypothetical protein